MKKRSGNQVKLDGTRANINLYQKSNSLDLPISRVTLTKAIQFTQLSRDSTCELISIQEKIHCKSLGRWWRSKKRRGNQVKLDGTRANINVYQKSNSLDLPISRVTLTKVIQFTQLGRDATWKLITIQVKILCKSLGKWWQRREVEAIKSS